MLRLRYLYGVGKYDLVYARMQSIYIEVKFRFRVA